MNWNLTPPADQQRFAPGEVYAAGLAQHHIANTAYPIAHVKTMRPYKVLRCDMETVARLAWADVGRLGLYVHVPFCESRCAYCEYAVLDPRLNHRVEDAYFDLLVREFELYGRALDTTGKTLIGFDIGGGTPAFASVANLARVVDEARRRFYFKPELTISIETTPRIAALDPDKIRDVRRLGIERISMGVQTIQPDLLKALERAGSTADFNVKAAENIRAAGFGKFNVDLMYGFARQSLHSWEATLNHAIGLGPEYITLYRMRYKGTRIAPQAAQVPLEAVNELSALASQMLHAAGYHANPGKTTYSKVPGDVGTSDYLTERVIHGTPYLGLGLGAQSLSHVTLSYNAGAADKSLRLYQEKVQAGELPLQDLYYLSREAAMGKMISVSFYFGEINLASFQNKFGWRLEEAFPAEVEFVLRRGLMEYTPTTLRLTPDGAKFYNGVIALFYAGAVKEHLLGLVQDTSTERALPRPDRERAGERVYV